MIFLARLLLVASGYSSAGDMVSPLMGVMAVANTLIALAYYSIPVSMAYLILKRRDLPFLWIFVLFALFILSCGTTHVLHVLALWLPVDGPQALADVITAAVSVATAVLIWPMLPKALALPSPSQLAAVNADLQKQIAQRERTEAELRLAYIDMEGRVARRTAELRAANEGLQLEIDERKHIEEALRRSEQRLRLHIEHTPLAVIEWNLDFRVAQWNAAAERIFGYSATEAIGQPASFIVPAQARSGVNEVWGRLLEHQEGEHITNENVAHNGRTLLCEWYNTPLVTAGGNVIGVTSLVQDVTERVQAEAALRASEAHFRALYADMTEGVALHEVLYDADGRPYNYRILDINAQYEAIMGIPREAAAGKLATELYSTPQPPYLAEFSAVADTGQPFRFETYFPPKNKYFNISVSNTGAGHFATIFFDITERKLAEAERERLLREVEAKNQELQSIVYVASHDLRSPLVNVQGFSKRLEKACGELTELLNRPDTPSDLAQAASPILAERMPKALHFIHASVEKMDSLLGGLLRLSRVGRAALRPQRLDMNQMLVNILAAMSFQTQAVAATIVVDPLPDGWGDPTQINQVFSNLLDNALKYRAPDRALELHVSGRIEGRQAIYTVADTGLGIAPEYQDKIWELFHRLDPNGPVTGEGLGLTLVRRILDRHNGQAWVESTPGQGSQFFVSLPAAQAVA
jgi:PAS domain S-box-containing protein